MLAESPDTFQNSPELRTERESSLSEVTQQASYKAKTTRNPETNPRILRKQETVSGMQVLAFQGCLLRSTSATYLVF